LGCGGVGVRSILLLALVSVIGFTGCGGGASSPGSSPDLQIKVFVAPTAGQSINAGASVKLQALISNNSPRGVTWSVTGPGELFFDIDPNAPPNTVNYIAPGGISTYAYAIVTATAVDNPSASGYAAFTVTPANTFPNVQPVSVNGGPVQGKIFPNRAYTSVTVCSPGTVNCKTIDGIQVDTGSSGLRILASALPSLPTMTDDSENVMSECVQFVDQSYIWGTLELADVRIAGEVARFLPIHAIAPPSGGAIPSACSGNGESANNGTQMALGANGILGVGLEPQDCGVLCDPNGHKTPPSPAYYACSGNSCNPAFVQLVSQISNPAVFFQKDNNGVVLQFPAPANNGDAITGSLIFGIGSQTNNMPGDATLFAVDENDHFTTNLSSTGQSLTASFIDSGADGLFFPDGNFVTCTGMGASFFCPASPTPLAAVNASTNGAQSTINFSVDNADNLLTNNPQGAAFTTLAGPNATGTCSNGNGACSFDWGLPFFYGRSVFVAINGQVPPTMPAPIVPGQPPGEPVPVVPIGPWWAYTTGFNK